MGKLIKKEFALAMHPIVPMMVLLSAMVMIPNYPYIVIFFYSTMSIFFTCLFGRENKDIIYSLNLPIPKRSIVKARFAFTMVVQAAQMLVMIPFSILNQSVNPAGNQAGMDANISLFALGFIVYGLFNFVFFGGYYKNVLKVGVAFVKSSILLFVLAGLDAALTNTVPFIKNVLDGRNSEHLAEKLVFLTAGVAVYFVLTGITYKRSVGNFEEQDLN